MNIRDITHENHTIDGFRAGVEWAVGALHTAADVVAKKGDVRSAAAWREAARGREAANENNTDERLRAKMRESR